MNSANNTVFNVKYDDIVICETYGEETIRASKEEMNDDEIDPRFDIDALQEVKVLCYFGPDCDKCKAYSGREEDRYPSMCEICYNQFTDHEGYSEADGSGFWCNMCAEQEAKKNFCQKCEERFDDETVPNEYDCTLCEVCYYLVPSKHQYYPTSDESLLEKYTEEQQTDLRDYAEEYNLNMWEAIDYQTHCHCCGKSVEDGIFDGKNHQYCSNKCFEYCEDYWYHCFREKCCRVCGISQYHKNREEKQKRDIEIEKYTPVLSAIDAFQDLKIDGQLYECLGDLKEYFAE
jgi:hypothetical protein